MPRFSPVPELPLELVRSTLSEHGAAALPAQLAEQLRTLILGGTLRPGDRLPSTRALAERLNVSRGTIVASFEQLSAEGYLQTSKAGTRVAENLKLQKISRPQPAPYEPENQPDRVLYHLTPGAPDTSLLASSAWRSAWRVAAAEAGRSYGAAGSLGLREEIAEHLRIMRHTLVRPSNLLVTAGARDGFRLLLSAFRRADQRKTRRPLHLAVENPGYPSLHRIPAAFGHTILPIPVDQHGLIPGRLPTGKNRPELVLVAPSHQYPLGASMPVARRLELLEWARQQSAYIVEDDYDSELRYTGDPLPALAALDDPADARVITLGSFSKTVSPALGLGYLLLPPQLRENVLELRQELGSPVSSITQDAMTLFLAQGGARRHISRMRKVYGQRRETLLGALADAPPWVQVLPMDGGLHVVLKFLGEYATADMEARSAERTRAAGLALGTLGEYWAASEHETCRDYGLVVGFGAAQDRELVAGVKVLLKSLDLI